MKMRNYVRAILFSVILLLMFSSCFAELPEEVPSETLADKSIIFEDGTYGIYEEKIIYDRSFIEGHLPKEYSVAYSIRTCDKSGKCIKSKLVAAVSEDKKYFLSDGNETVFLPSYEGYFCYVRSGGEKNYKCINERAPMDESTVKVYENTFLNVCGSHSDYCSKDEFKKIGKEKFCGRDCIMYEYKLLSEDGIENVFIRYRIDSATGICLSTENITPDFSASDTYIDFECSEFQIENVIISDVKS